MPVPIPMAIRQKIVELHRSGISLKNIAQNLRLSFWTVRKLWRSAREQASVPPNYAACGPAQPRTARLVYRAAHWLKRRHPAWGARFVLALFAERWPHQTLPHPRTVQRWWQRAQLSQPRLSLPPQHKARAQQVHEVWQMDATSHLRLADQSGASWLSLVDEVSRAVLAAVAFPPLRVGER